MAMAQLGQEPSPRNLATAELTGLVETEAVFPPTTLPEVVVRAVLAVTVLAQAETLLVLAALVNRWVLRLRLLLFIMRAAVAAALALVSQITALTPRRLAGLGEGVLGIPEITRVLMAQMG
jgi:hypothetical protein